MFLLKYRSGQKPKSISFFNINLSRLSLVFFWKFIQITSLPVKIPQISSSFNRFNFGMDF